MRELLFRVLVGAFLLFPLIATPAGASCPGACDPTDPNTGPCCAADCNWLPAYDSGASDNTGAECNWPGNECAIRYCNGSHQCAVTPPSGSQNKPEGEACSPALNKCVLGTCTSGGACNTPSPTVPRCSADVCDPESCQQATSSEGNKFFQACNDAALSNPPPACNAVVLGVCYPKICNATTRQCDANGDPVACTDQQANAGACEVGACTFSNGNATCTTAPAAAGTTCNDGNAWDCKHHVCDGGGHCDKAVRKSANSPCDPSSTNGDHCTMSVCTATAKCRTGGNATYPLAYDETVIPLPVDTTGALTPQPTCPGTTAAVCQHAACGGNPSTYAGSGTCASTPDASQNGNACTTDSNACTTQACASGTCAFSACNATSTACGGCGAVGHCPGTTGEGSCSCVQ